MRPALPAARRAPIAAALATAAALIALPSAPASTQASTPACVPADFVVAVDIGHSVDSPGAVSARGVPELHFNRALAAALMDALEAAGFTKGVLINGDGHIGSLAQRVREAKQAGAHLLLSIHHDSVQPRYLSRWTVDGISRRYSDRFRGFSLFVSADNPHFEASRRLAVLIARAWIARGMTPTLHHAEPIPGEHRPLIEPELGVYRFDQLHVLRHAPMPAVLIEAGVILHRDEELELGHPARQQRLADGIAAALLRFCDEDGGGSPHPAARPRKALPAPGHEGHRPAHAAHGRIHWMISESRTDAGSCLIALLLHRSSEKPTGPATKFRRWAVAAQASSCAIRGWSA